MEGVPQRIMYVVLRCVDQKYGNEGDNTTKIYSAMNAVEAVAEPQTEPSKEEM